ncbi:MAG TPA: ABC transporter permease [Puia sp.]|jgi:ABC-type lipoprotein release transport system permease subunit|nr:ABC transporter permease [Puia sp.]
MLKTYWLIAVRKMLRYKVQSFINILGLTIGITACLVIYLLTRHELSYDTFHPNKDRIYRVVAEETDNGNSAKRGFLLVPLPVRLRDELTGVSHVAAFYLYKAKVNIPENGATRTNATRANATRANAPRANATPGKLFDAPGDGMPIPLIVTDSQYFGMFHYQWLAGNAATSLINPHSVVLTESEMKKYFGNIAPDQAMGRTVIYADSLDMTVRGIVKDWTGNSDLNYSDFLSLSTVPGSFLKNTIDLTQWGGWWARAQAFVELAPGATVQRVERQFPAILNKYWQHGKGDTAALALQPLRDLHFNAEYKDYFIRKAHLPTLYGLMGIAGFILLLAAINFINLSTAQSLFRTKEIGIRKVLGSRRKDIAIQFLGETLLITILAVLVSVLITPTVIFLLHDYLPPGVHLDSSLLTLAFLGLIAVCTALLAGWYPARVISGLLPVLSLKGQTSKSAIPNRYLHRALIVFQFTISAAFILCTVIVARQLRYVLNTDLGFSSDAILTFRPADSDPTASLEAFANALSKMPEVELVTRHMETPISASHSGTGFDFEGPAGKTSVDAAFDLADTTYLRLFGLKLVAGRNFFASDTMREMLVNEAATKQMGFGRPEDALGTVIRTGVNHGGGPIVGVIKDFHARDMHSAITPFFVSTNRDWWSVVSIRLAPAARNPEAIHALLGKAERIWHETFPNETFKCTFFDDSIAALYSNERHLSNLLRLAMVIAILISCMGLLGLASFAAQQRRKEMSIRKVLGATAGRIVALLTESFLWPVALAFAIAVPVAWYFMDRWLQSFVYRTTMPWWIFAYCGVAAIAIALLTVGYQALRTAMVSPAEGLRTD